MDCPSRLFVEVTTRCNLRCGMCVKQTDNTGIAEGAMPRETFAALRPAFPYLKALILNGIGEPLLHPHLEEFIRTARKTLPEGAWVGFQTNGMLLDEARAEALLDAGLDLRHRHAAPSLWQSARTGDCIRYEYQGRHIGL